MDAKEATKILHSAFENIDFNEDWHVYTVEETKLPSVTQQTKTFYNEFPAEEIAPYSANKWNENNPDKPPKTADDILREWTENAESARNKGTSIHHFAEYYDTLFNEATCSEEQGVVNWFRDKPKKYVSIANELPVCNLKYAGTPDRIFFNTETQKLVIVDWKTNGDIFKNYNNQSLKVPFEDLLDNPFNKYQLQLNLYKMAIEEKTPLIVEKMLVVWLHTSFINFYNQYEVEDFTERLSYAGI